MLKKTSRETKALFSDLITQEVIKRLYFIVIEKATLENSCAVTLFRKTCFIQKTIKFQDKWEFSPVRIGKSVKISHQFQIFPGMCSGESPEQGIIKSLRIA